MMSGSSVRFAMTSICCIAKQTRVFATPVLRNGSPADFQTPANKGFLLRNARLLHTSFIRKSENPSQDTAKNDEGTVKKPALRDRLKFVVAEYGTTAIVFHVTISLTSLGICYAAVKRSVDVHFSMQRIMSKCRLKSAGKNTCQLFQLGLS